MTLGKIVKTLNFEVVYGRKGTGTLVAGRAAAVDASGDFIPATASTTSPHGIVSGLTEIRGAVTYHQIVVDGYVGAEMGGAVKPNKHVKSDANGKLIAATVGTDDTKYVAIYIRLRTDDQFNPTDAADTNEGVVKVIGFSN